MGLYIKGMEMPTDGMKNIMIIADGRVFQFSGYGNPKPLGTAVPVPAHGRLIDADKLKSYWEPDHSRYFDADYFIHTIDVAQTIIPASEEE